jgi:hypothetical protein
LSAIGRRGLPGVHGKEEHENSGTSSPKSGISTESSKTVGSRIRGWTRTAVVPEEGLTERIEEIEVGREMEREALEEEREMDDMKAVEEAKGGTTPREGPNQGSDKMSGAGREDRVTVRVVLRSPGTGKLVCLKVVEGAGLCVLRDTG